MIAAVAGASLRSTEQVAAPPVGAGSAEGRLLVMIIQNQLTQGESAKANINISDEQLKHLRELVSEALEAAREAQDDSGFWGEISSVLGSDLGTLCQVVAVAAASVCSFGTAAVALAAIVVACTLASKYADDLGIPPKVAIGLGIAAAVGSAACGNVGSASASVASAAAETGTTAARVIQIAGHVRDVARVGAAVCTAGSAVATGVSGYYEGEALDDNADAQAARNRQTTVNMDLDQAIDLLGAAIDRELAAMGAFSQIDDARNRTNQLIIGGTA